jgi:hypothetical protein
LRKIPCCCLPQESGPCLSPRVAGRPLRPATDHRLGRPLPHQPANRTQPPPDAGPKGPFDDPGLPGPPHAVLHTVSGGYPPHQGRSATRSSPVRLGRSPKGLPIDLHALGTPPAFILSQDQTLHQNTHPSQDACDAYWQLFGLVPSSQRKPNPHAANHASVGKVQ